MMRLSEAATVLGGKLAGADVSFTGVGTDTRTLRAGELFVALRGDTHDGHRFLPQARAAGAAAALVEESAGLTPEHDLPLLHVADARRALGDLAAAWRDRFSIPVVALTGSSGKTTVKEMLAAILREAARRAAAADEAEAVLATRGNLNNDIGMPLTLLGLRAGHRYAVIEMGMNHAGEIRALTKLARPDVALVNNAGSAHIEYLGSHEAIARAKGEIFEGLGSRGIAVINADDRFAPLWRELAGGARRVEFGLEQAADVTADYELDAAESAIVLKVRGDEARTTIAAPGLHNVRNALAAAAAAVALEIPLDVIAAGLGAFSGMKGRLERKVGLKGASVLDDTYNANPESMRAGFAVLARAAGKKLLVLGDMGELGAAAAELHTELGAAARAAGIDRLFALGEQSKRTAAAFGAGATHYASIEALLDDVRAALAPDVTILVKGSRFMRMERVVQAIVSDEGREGSGAHVH
jgi:UDP-N-acetylmuramoyl-tripeptide--D-alanyl-D-alanine ligase